MSFSPVEASKRITEKYRRYLQTIFSINDDKYNNQFVSQLKDMKLLSAGPYLDVSDSFVKGKSIEELIKEDVLAKGFKKINMPISRPLYKHQELSIRKAISGNNLIVSTGTGSGKTESFLIPVLNHIIREHEAGKLNSGVRALLIYPMNALANDQVERLRFLLSDYPEITYGSYTGQTKNKYEDALAEYMQLNEGKEPLANELISRDQIKKNPPHILITNYAMLEYLMVRPGDSVFFSADKADKWKYIVLDEAHVYNGSSGIEVAMLLRRLKAKLENTKINYILTSATLGDEKSDNEVAEFGSNLCDSKFDRSNIVRAFRMTPTASHEMHVVPINEYSELAELLNEEKDKEVRGLLGSYEEYCDKDSVEENLYNIILHDNNYSKVKNIVMQTRTIEDIASQMNWSVKQLESFVTVASKAEKNGDRLFDARYHMFLRATESVFITLDPSNKLFLTRKKKHVEKDGTEYAVFEIATCSVCHSIYLLGTIKDGFFVQSSFKNEDELRTVFLLKNSISDSDDEHLMEDENIEAEEYEICPRCGFVRKAGGNRALCCEHGAAGLIKVYKVEVKQENGSLTKCLACENTNMRGILRTFFTGQEAVTSILGTALFEELPSYKIVTEITNENEDDGGFGGFESVTETRKITEAKQFIAFSDSRQAAAYFASYFDQTYQNILYRRLVVETLKEYRDNWAGDIVNNIVQDVAAKFEQYEIVDKNTGRSIREGWKAVLHEMADVNGTTSLFNLGLLGFTLNPDLISENKKLGLTQEEVVTLCNVFAVGMMAEAALCYDFSMNKADREFFAHNGAENGYTLATPEVKHNRRSFIPRFFDKTNKRTEYLSRVLETIGKKAEYPNPEDVNKLLETIWKYIFVGKEYLKLVDGAYRIDCSKVRITKPSKWYICPECKRITPYSIRGICPTYKCAGTLRDINLESHYKDNHYYRTYQDMDIRGMRVVEHTAQLSKEMAYEYQRKFKKKEIDVLSCSTTFEMGVDVGSLETVFMRNMPPSPANYAQRAGRAGRSKQSAAFALTFCNKSNHDFSFFSDPVQMIKGRIDPPKFIVENEKIAIRHIYASALSFFWARYPDFFDNATKMIDEPEEGKSGIQAFEQYLYSKPEELKLFLKRFLPVSMISRFNVDDFGWVDLLLGKDETKPGVLTKAVAEYNYEVGTLLEAKEEADKKDNKTDGLRERIKVYKNEEILAFLSRKNVMPRYGFPVDTVEMQIVGNSEKSKLGLQLQRDLAMAISEYAPGSQIVANGNLITSRYIRKVPQMSWKMYDYIYCNCKTLNIEPHIDESANVKLCTCKQCGEELDSGRQRVFLVPEFGFEADGEKIEKPGLKKPERTYKSDVSYVGYRDNIETNRFEVSGATVEIAVSKSDEMAVINDSNFFVCENCGYTELDEKCFKPFKKVASHKNPSGFKCSNTLFKRFSLGYRFETDVLQLRFLSPELTDWEDSISVLYGLIRGACSELNIEQDEIAGCVQFFYNDISHKANFEIVLYDKTPGGAGHVRRLANQDVLARVLKRTLKIMENCDCGGADKDSSCYSCLRSYYNQKHHDILSRGRVINFINDILTDEGIDAK